MKFIVRQFGLTSLAAGGSYKISAKYFNRLPIKILQPYIVWEDRILPNSDDHARSERSLSEQLLFIWRSDDFLSHLSLHPAHYCLKLVELH